MVEYFDGLPTVAGQLPQDLGKPVTGCKASYRGLAKIKISTTCKGRLLILANRNYPNGPTHVLGRLITAVIITPTLVKKFAELIT